MATVDHKKYKIVIKGQFGEVLFEEEMDAFVTTTDHVVYPVAPKITAWQLVQGNAEWEKDVKLETIQQQIMTVKLKTKPSSKELYGIALHTDDEKLKAADILEKAADVLLRDGWTQGKYHKPKEG